MKKFKATLIKLEPKQQVVNTVCIRKYFFKPPDSNIYLAFKMFSSTVSPINTQIYLVVT